MFVLIAVDAVAMAISEDEPDQAGDDAESLHESEAVCKTSLAVSFSTNAVILGSVIIKLKHNKYKRR